MSRLIYVPLEHIEGRYTVHMDRDITNYLDEKGIDYLKIMPEAKSSDLPEGMFLNAAFTTRFKSMQMATIAALYEQDEINTGDVFFFSDIWFPGIESIAYMNYFHKKKTSITGIIHAGSFTDTDFVRDLERWAKNFEDVIFDISDKVFCASNFIRNDILKKRIVDPNKLIVSGLPVDYSGLDNYLGMEKEKIVIFNGRLCDEKQPWLFEELERKIKNLGAEETNWKDATFIKTQEENLNKDEYYSLLGRSACTVSYALQENFGFGIAEAAYLGSTPVVPNRLVYPELYDSKYLYDSFEESVDMVFKALTGNLKESIVIDNNCMDVWFEEIDNAL